MTKKQITYRLVEARIKSGKSIRQMAEETGISPSTIEMYMYKGSMPGADKLSLLCQSLGVSADWVLGLTEGVTRGGL